MTFQEFINEAQVKQQEIVNLNNELNNKKELYKAYLKTHVGITDGEALSIVDILKAAKRVMELG
jgi:cupin superfamily acireductone dioxygenase involved in methionine salvage